MTPTEVCTVLSAASESLRADAATVSEATALVQRATLEIERLYRALQYAAADYSALWGETVRLRAQVARLSEAVEEGKRLQIEHTNKV